MPRRIAGMPAERSLLSSTAQGSKPSMPMRLPRRSTGSSSSRSPSRRLHLHRLAQLGDEAADAHRVPRALHDAAQDRHVLQVVEVARVVLGDDQHAARVGADTLRGRHRRVHAKRQELRIEVVEAAGKEVGVDGCQLEAAVAQVHRRVERRSVLRPALAEPPLDFGALVQHYALELLERTGEMGGEVGNHVVVGMLGGRGFPGTSLCRREDQFTRSRHGGLHW